MAESIEVFMPALSSTMTEGKIVDWTVKVGDKVKAGQTVMIVESDKGECSTHDKRRLSHR
jgi:pyruvate dehydrogenase E2 component (dihydrolipoamide acetyltransferase)